MPTAFDVVSSSVSLDAPSPPHPPAGRDRLVLIVAILVTLTLAALECWYGKTAAGDVFGSDAISYMDTARAISRGDWLSALNPLWSQGYPALLALARPLFPAGPEGEWLVTRAVNFGVFCFLLTTFCCLLGELCGRRWWRDSLFLVASLGIVLSTQVCLGQVSRVGPDNLLAGFFFLAAALFLKLLRSPAVSRMLLVSLAFGLTLGAGFVVKTAFLALGGIMLATLATALLLRRGPVARVVPAAAVFGAVLLTYGTALSGATGYRTLGDSGSINYAWHTNRLVKWVHWEGGNQPVNVAWPSAALAKFAHWESDPPDFGKPVHPSQVVGEKPSIYVFNAPMQATYLPYFDPPYWYQGYHHLFRWRYQLIAIVRSMVDLAMVLAKAPMTFAVVATLTLLFFRRSSRSLGTHNAPGVAALCVCCLLGIAVYLPVHLEGRYLSSFLAVLAVLAIKAMVQASAKTRRLTFTVLMFGLAAQLVVTQYTIWSRALHGWSYRNNVEWQTSNAVIDSGLPAGTKVGMISWTANLYCDWAYLSKLRIIAEIQTGDDEKAFWHLSPEAQQQVLQRFHEAGANAVITRDPPNPPLNSAAGWQQAGSAPVWIYRF